MSNLVLQNNLLKMLRKIKRLDLQMKQYQVFKTSNIIAVREAAMRRIPKYYTLIEQAINKFEKQYKHAKVQSVY